eukprot:TRINITY_DN3601_c0_g1_i2.p1 TRINITY_DN3601_c0_g1~~TRINITY_DN3601_c0_g1_i2.p1  ORF type:complete len:196 (-),score=2.28 TRINITY_DN3601_c0_g1_i2:286-873(-)
MIRSIAKVKKCGVRYHLALSPDLSTKHDVKNLETIPDCRELILQSPNINHEGVPILYSYISRLSNLRRFSLKINDDIESIQFDNRIIPSSPSLNILSLSSLSNKSLKDETISNILNTLSKFRQLKKLQVCFAYGIEPSPNFMNLSNFGHFLKHLELSLKWNTSISEQNGHKLMKSLSALDSLSTLSLSILNFDFC